MGHIRRGMSSGSSEPAERPDSVAKLRTQLRELEERFETLQEEVAKLRSTHSSQGGDSGGTYTPRVPPGMTKEDFSHWRTKTGTAKSGGKWTQD